MGTRKTNLDSVSPEERAIVEAKRAYAREWRKNHKEQVAEHKRRFWLKKAAEQVETNKKA